LALDKLAEAIRKDIAPKLEAGREAAPQACGVAG
jgi:hypothetical protein